MKGTSRTAAGWLLFIVIMLLATAAAASAQNEIGTAQLAGVKNGSSYDYTITLNNTGTVPIGTFWYAWIPFPSEFYLPSNPASVTAPSGWSGFVVGTYSIEYVAGSGHSLAPASSQKFEFTSIDSPATLAGNSPKYPGTPIGTSFLYEGAAFSDPGYKFVVQVVPEPSSIAVLAAGVLGLASAGLTKRRRGTG